MKTLIAVVLSHRGWHYSEVSCVFVLSLFADNGPWALRRTQQILYLVLSIHLVCILTIIYKQIFLHSQQFSGNIRFSGTVGLDLVIFYMHKSLYSGGCSVLIPFSKTIKLSFVFLPMTSSTMGFWVAYGTRSECATAEWVSNPTTEQAKFASHVVFIVYCFR